MNQYCRYCCFMCCGDANWCDVHKKCMSDQAIKRVNKCKDFAFNEIDALGINLDGYKPRAKKEKKKEYGGLFDEI